MIKKKLTHFILAAAAAAALITCSVTANEINQQTADAYNAAVTDQELQKGFHATVEESTTSAKTGITSKKNVDITVTGFTNDMKDMKAVIKETIDDTDNGKDDGIEEVSYYADGNYYSTEGGEKIKTPMDIRQIGGMINMDIYHALMSSSLSMLYANTNEDGTLEYQFSATNDTLGEYKTMLLDMLTGGEGSVINYLQGTMKVDADGHVKERSIDMDYTLAGENGTSEMFHKKAKITFDKIGDDVKIELPDLSAYKEKTAESQPSIETKNQKVWATADVNVRSSGSTDAAIIGSAEYGTPLIETGTTSDGWTQIDYDGKTGYVFSKYLSAQEPPKRAEDTKKAEAPKAQTTTSQSSSGSGASGSSTSGKGSSSAVADASGTMYTTAGVNVRSGDSTSASPIGSLAKGEAVTITGTTATGWTRIKFNGGSGFVSSQYLTWTKPAQTQTTGYVYGTVTSAMNGTFTVYADGGYYITFNSGYAPITCDFGRYYLEIGDYIGVTYTSNGTSNTATAITLYGNAWVDEGEEEYDDYDENADYTERSMSGTVNWYDSSSGTLSVQDYSGRGEFTFGTYGSEAQSPASIQTGLYPGASVTVYYYGDGYSRYGLTATLIV